MKVGVVYVVGIVEYDGAVQTLKMMDEITLDQ